MIEEISLRFGEDPLSPPLKFSTTPITIFVGPNYSGKSKLISEISTHCNHGFSSTGEVILSSVNFRSIPPEEIEVHLERLKLPRRTEDGVPPNYIPVGKRGSRVFTTKNNFFRALSNPNDPELRNYFAQYFASHETTILTGSNRIEMARDQPAEDLQAIPNSSLNTLFRNNALRDRLRRIVFDAFGLHLVIDPTSIQTLRFRLSKEAPPSEAIERGLTEASVAFHAAATLLNETSDGARAFVGILSEILAGNPEILLMDEPEAFLHPSLAYVLGREVSKNIAATKKKIFVSTHSPHFLMGCVQSGVPVNVVRLTYRNSVSTARILRNSELVTMMRNPLLRSAGVLSALFYESAIVTEADPDRAFYQEINDRLLQENTGRGIPNAIFLNAQNKQTIPYIVEPLRKLGIPAAAVYDIDVVKDKAPTSTRIMSASGVPSSLQNSLTTLRSQVHNLLSQADPNFKTSGGISILSSSERETSDNYIQQMATYGNFIVENGELESWLPNLNINEHGPKWLIKVFEAIGEDPSDENYTHPGTCDVWSFLDSIRHWLLDPNRKGMRDI